MAVSGQLHALAVLPPGKKPLCTQWTGSWVDPKAGLDEMVTRKNPSIAIAGK